MPYIANEECCKVVNAPVESISEILKRCVYKTHECLYTADRIASNLYGTSDGKDIPEPKNMLDALYIHEKDIEMLMQKLMEISERLG